MGEPNNDAKDVALAKINDIRNSIIGCQTVNWSEHVYPLVAALEDAGIEGAGYPESRAYVGTMLERTLAAEDALAGKDAEIARSVEKERLRFEGDLDKWMKIIGAGITGYQPEAYAVMDHACGELVRARAEIKRLRTALQYVVDWHGTRDNHEKLLPPDQQNDEIRLAMLALGGKADA